MVKQIIYTFLVIFLVCLSPAAASEILVWDNDSGVTFYSTCSYRVEGFETSIVEALEKNGYAPDVVTELPENLQEYDALFIVLGVYCPT